MSAQEVDEFVRRCNGKWNIYYSVNPTRTRMNKKASKTDIAQIEYALADLDPKDDEDRERRVHRHSDVAYFVGPGRNARAPLRVLTLPLTLLRSGAPLWADQRLSAAPAGGTLVDRARRTYQ
jgi:hypothetical protein